jgi:O-antigen/teichoic acid export membrane protein
MPSEHSTGQLVRNIGSTLVTRVAVMLVALASSILLARLLGPEGRGVFALLLLVPSLATSLGLLGFEQANAVYAGLEPRGRRILVWQSVAVALGVGGALAAAAIAYVLLGAPGFSALATAPRALVVLLLATIPARMLVEYWSAVLRGMNRIRTLNLFEIACKLAPFVGVVVLVWALDLGVAGAAWSDAAASVGAAVAIALVLKTLGAWGRPTWDSKLWWRVATFAIPVHAGTIAAYFNYRVDEFIVAAFLPIEALGLYAIAVGLAERIWIISGSVATVLLPHLTNRRAGDATVSAAICRHVVIWTGAACIVVAAIVDPVITVLFGRSFAGAAQPLRWLLPGIFTLSIGKVLVAELLVRERPRYTVWASGAAVVANVVGNLLLVPRIGIPGAAIASSVSYSILSAILVVCYLRVTGSSWIALVPRARDFSVYIALWRQILDTGARQTSTRV